MDSMMSTRTLGTLTNPPCPGIILLGDGVDEAFYSVPRGKGHCGKGNNGGHNKRVLEVHRRASGIAFGRESGEYNRIRNLEQVTSRRTIHSSFIKGVSHEYLEFVDEGGVSEDFFQKPLVLNLQPMIFSTWSRKCNSNSLSLPAKET